MKVLVADKLEKSALDGIAALGAEVLFEPDLKDESLQDRLAESAAEVLVVRSTKVTAPMIHGSGLKVIVRAGAGYNTIDVEAATQKGTKVSNCPGKNANAVAELAFGLIIACDRQIVDNALQLRAGKWDKVGFGKNRGLAGRTLGIVGLGNIGRIIAKAGQAFGMKVITHSIPADAPAAEEMGIEMVSLCDLAERSDAVSINCALTSATRGMIDAPFFESLKPGTIFVNTSRAEVVDQDALLKVVHQKGVRAGLDVFADEPTEGKGEYSGPMKDEDKVYVTHHIGASTEQAQEAVAAETVRIIQVFMNSGNVPNAVN